MLKQRELAFIKAMTNSEVSTVFLRELRRALVAAKKKKASGAQGPTLRTLRSSSVRADPEARL
jgi:hypothetical protein